MDEPQRRDDETPMHGSWNSDPKRIDGYQFGGLPYPVETTRHAYLTLLGGFSAELAEDAIGLHRQALAENTDLQPGDRVTIKTRDEGQPVPFIKRPAYRVTPLDFETPDAFLHSTEGQAVLPAAAPREGHPGVEEAEDGIELVINGVIAARMRSSGS
jgi:hypothetical protein